MCDVDIVVPAYNDAGTLERCVSSLLISPQVAKVIIVDDCSTDGTLAEAERLRDAAPNSINVISCDCNVGSLEARRRGFNATNSAYVMFVDADDALSQGCIDAALACATEEGADIVAFSIVPEYSAGALPEMHVVQARERQYAVGDEKEVFSGDEIVHAIYRDNKVVWSVVAKFFRRSAVEVGFSGIPELNVFQSEDALMMLSIALHADVMVASSEIPPYRYMMGVGGTVVDQLVTAGQFASVCKNRRVVDTIEGLLLSSENGSRFAEDFTHTRDALRNDPCNRFPSTVLPAERAAAFHELVETWGVTDAVAGLAAMHREHPEEVLQALDGVSWPEKKGVIRTIGLVYHSLGMGGVENKIRQMCSMLKEDLHLRVVLYIDEGAECCDVPAGVEVVRLPDCFASAADYAARAGVLGDSLQSLSVDCLIHSQWLGLAAPWDALLAKCLGVSVHMHVHGVYFSAIGYDLPDLYHLPLTYGIYDSVICLSEVDASYWRRFNPRVLVTVNGIRSEFQHVERANLRGPRSHRVVWLGRVDVDKGIEDAFCALGQLISFVPDARLAVIGPVAASLEGEPLNSMLRAHGVESAVVFLGPMSASQIVEVFADSDAFLLSSSMEGWSIGLLEAKASGLPCVMYDLVNLPLCREGSGVLTARLGNPAGLGGQLARIMLDADLAARLSQEARTDAERYMNYPFSEFWRGVVFGEGGFAYPVENDTGMASCEEWRAFADMFVDKARRDAEARHRQGALEQENLALAQRVRYLESIISQLKSPVGIVRLCARKIKRLVASRK